MILKRKDEGEEIKVIDIFSISNFGFMRREKMADQIKKITRIRKSEESEVSRLAGTTTEYWNFPEVFVRGHRQWDVALGEKERILKRTLFGKIESAIKKLSASEFYFPLGIGNHIDHIMVFQTGLALTIRHPHLRIKFYEDLPYAGYHKFRDNYGQNFHRKNILLRSELIDITKYFEEKLKICDLYTSQKDQYWIRALKLHAKHLFRNGNACMCFVNPFGDKMFERIWRISIKMGALNNYKS
jgi:LmbE family N-acetylglucosaminyl deacetylase